MVLPPLGQKLPGCCARMQAQATNAQDNLRVIAYKAQNKNSRVTPDMIAKCKAERDEYRQNFNQHIADESLVHE